MVHRTPLVALTLTVGRVVGQTTNTLPGLRAAAAEVKGEGARCRPEEGLLVKELRPGVFMIAEGADESVFATTGSGVVLCDAPPSSAQHIASAVRETTREPIMDLVYTHVHVDHIGGVGIVLQRNPSTERLAESGTAESCAS
jgi:glyoxylase-like metal-dependent hydrolase (beta-lactamase superfamily II)